MCERRDVFMMKFYRELSAEKTYSVTQYSNVTTQFALMMEALHMYVPEYSTQTWNSNKD